MMVFSFSQNVSGSRLLGLSRAFLEPAINRFELLERIEQLQAGIPGLVCALSELFSVLDGEFDAVNNDPRLVGHFELDGRGPRIHFFAC
jgi:hypothetical protein